MFRGGKYAIGGHVLKKKVFEEINIPYTEGDVIYIQSDGFQDQFGGMAFKKYLKKRYRELLQKQYHVEMFKQKETLSEEFHYWKGKTSSDG